ncbi:MAG TPA: coniferyl aldehyde dehydrogenase [Candidatus Acidoferrales bacterium]|nr:coniferyl aldehyde dehydrogenase [Candidatus Acidoferrales bacterium]
MSTAEMLVSTAQNLPRLLQMQRDSFMQGAPTYDERMRALATLRDSLRTHQEELLRAVSEDFGGRAREETLMLELFPLFDQIQHARSHLRSWMKRRWVRSSWFLLPSRAFHQYQPLGVVGVIGAWNYQVYLTLGPAVDAITAGNHVMLKPSEIAPRSAEVIARIVADCFPPEYVTCVTGGPEVASAFASLPFDHLFFTGSTRVGRMVMQAAAANLTPVTLELGGKCPAILHESYPMETAVHRIVSGKLFNAGQTCVAPDYVLLPEGKEAEFEARVRRRAASLYPELKENPDYTRIVSHRHFERLSGLVADARAKGARLVELASAEQGSLDDKVFVPTLVFNPTDAMGVMQEEIFGPILPVVTYRTLDEAVAYVNSRPRPLALYYFDEDMSRINHVLERTMSGGVTLNDCIYHLAQHNLPFGGVGPSGMGHYHGFDGFVTFSKKRAVMLQRRFSSMAVMRPPYKNRRRLFESLLKMALR